MQRKKNLAASTMLAVFVAVNVIMAVSVHSLDYPTRPIQVAIGGSPGGDKDTNMRLLGKYLEQKLGQPIIIQNIRGAGGSLATQDVLDSPADGYKFVLTDSGTLINTISQVTEYGYEDFDIISVVMEDNTSVILVNGEVRFNSMQGFIEHAKANELDFATEIGAFTHMEAMAIEQETGITLNMVDVGGGSDKIVAILGGQTDVTILTYAQCRDYVESGAFKALAVMGETASPFVPNVKSLKEQGIDVAFSKFFVLLGPKGIPQEIKDKLSETLDEVGAMPEFQDDCCSILLTDPILLDETSSKEYLDRQFEKMVKVFAR